MLYIWAIISGALIGFSVCVGASRMFKAPEVQGMGAFRTLGELNACKGDSISHFSVGLGFFISSAAAATGTGALTQDIHHRVLPNWAAAIVSFRNKHKKTNFITSPSRMGFTGMILGMIIVPLLIGANQAIPGPISEIAKQVLSPSANWLFRYVMPAIFLLAAIGAGKYQAIYSLLFASLSQIISGNALPGIVLGILVGSVAAHLGHKNKKTWIAIISITLLFVTIFYFRNMDSSTGLLKDGAWDKFLEIKQIK